MKKDDVFKLMNEVDFFQKMTAQEKEQLWSFQDYFLEYDEGAKILAEGSADSGFYVLLKGDLSVIRSEPTQVVLAQLVVGSIFGEVTLQGKRTRSNSVIADNACMMLKVDAELVDKLPAELVVKLKDQVIGLLINRLEEVNRKLGSFVR